MRLGGACSTNGGEEECMYYNDGKGRMKRPLARLKCRWVDKFEIHLTEIGRGDVDLTDVTQDRDHWRALVNTVVNLWVL
jgi:hypothetical protein